MPGQSIDDIECMILRINVPMAVQFYSIIHGEISFSKRRNKMLFYIILLNKCSAEDSIHSVPCLIWLLSMVFLVVWECDEVWFNRLVRESKELIQRSKSATGPCSGTCISGEPIVLWLLFYDLTSEETSAKSFFR